MKARTAFVAVMLLVLIPALSFADSAESKRLFNQGQYAMGIIAAKGSLGDYNITPKERAASYYWQGKNQIAKGDVISGIYSLKKAVKTRSSATYTDELAKVADKYAGQNLDCYRVCEQFLGSNQKALARKQLRSAYLARIKALAKQGNISRAESRAKEIYRFDSSVRSDLARIFSESALASNDPEKAGKSAKIALGYVNGENKALGQKFLAMSKQIEKIEGPFDRRVDKFYQLAQKFDSSIPDNVVQCEFGERKIIRIPPRGEFTRWYKTPPRRCGFDIFLKKGADPNFIIYFSNGKRVVKRYLGEPIPSGMNFVKMKFQSIVDKEQLIAVDIRVHSQDKRIASFY